MKYLLRPLLWGIVLPFVWAISNVLIFFYNFIYFIWNWKLPKFPLLKWQGDNLPNGESCYHLFEFEGDIYYYRTYADSIFNSRIKYVGSNKIPK